MVVVRQRASVLERCARHQYAVLGAALLVALAAYGSLGARRIVDGARSARGSPIAGLGPGVHGA